MSELVAFEYLMANGPDQMISEGTILQTEGTANAGALK